MDSAHETAPFNRLEGRYWRAWLAGGNNILLDEPTTANVRRHFVECGRSLPIAKRKSDGWHCVLDLSRGVDALVWHSQKEADSFAEARQWTELERSLSVPIACVEPSTGSITSQPMMVFENETLLDVANRVPRPDHRDGQYLMWQALKGADSCKFAACAISLLVDRQEDAALAAYDAAIELADTNGLADFEKDLREAIATHGSLPGADEVRIRIHTRAATLKTTVAAQ